MQIVARRLDHGQLFAVALAPGGGHRDFTFSGQIHTGDGVLIGHNFGWCALGHYVAAVDPGPRTDVENIVRLADRFLVVFNHDHGIALITQVFKRCQKTVIVALVQTDGRLVQHIQHARQAGADLRREPDPLAFATGQGAGVTRHSQVI